MGIGRGGGAGRRNVPILSACIDNASALNSIEVFLFFFPAPAPVTPIPSPVKCLFRQQTSLLRSVALKPKKQQCLPLPLLSAERETARHWSFRG